jgi:hypothetical protein
VKPEGTSGMTTDDSTDYGLNQPHPARIYNYWLGGKDNFKVDREAGDALAEALPRFRWRPAPIAASWSGWCGT